jgi:septal ring factor EnvC (AmiA/AmiB activator)
MSEANWWAAALAAIASGIVSWWISRLSKSFDARGAAEAALIGTGPTIIAEQNRRIQAIQEDNGRLWQQVQEGHVREQKCQEEVNTLQEQVRDQRHQIRELQTKVNALEHKIGTLDED